LEDIMAEPHPITIRAIDHLVIRAKDLETMVGFYRDVLGCREERRASELGLVQLRAGHSLIDLVDVAGALGREGSRAPDPEIPNMDHFCVQVEPWDADAIRTHLTAHGIEAGDVVSRYGALGSGPSIYIDDPEGNTVELKGPPKGA
jgi:catechol 2,3-dioxygenase-like lactoylglutathione lyase family enzyme